MTDLAKQDIVKDYCRQYPAERSGVLARWIYDNPAYRGKWSSVEAVRISVRYYRGRAGNANRDNRPGQVAIPTQLPKGKRQRLPTISLPPGRWLILSDIHCPYHDERAIDAALKYGRDRKADSLLFNGDALDAYQCSQWLRDPRADSVDKELRQLRDVIAYASQGFARGAYKIGNHEERVEHYLQSNAPHRPGADRWNLCDSLATALDLDDYIMIAGKQFFKLGRLHGYHGHELPKGLTNPVSVSRGIYLRTKQNAFAGHWHRSDSTTETCAHKKHRWGTIGIGCLCDLMPAYAPVNNWSQGCCVVDVGARGDYQADNRRIFDGRIE